MPLHVDKRGLRALGIAESFQKDKEKSILAGVVMRADLVVDGFGFAYTTVGGMDATQSIIQLYKSLNRQDINLLLLNGCVISWYNVVDLNKLHKSLNLPLICVTYEESEGLEKYFREYFPHDWEERVEVYHRNGERVPIQLSTGHKIFVRFLGMELDEAETILNRFTLHGSVPEPLRVARLLARAVLRSRLPQL